MQIGDVDSIDRLKLVLRTQVVCSVSASTPFALHGNLKSMRPDLSRPLCYGMFEVCTIHAETRCADARAEIRLASCERGLLSNFADPNDGQSRRTVVLENVLTQYSLLILRPYERGPRCFERDPVVLTTHGEIAFGTILDA